ncbi:MAG: hypothetical protein LBQ14_05225 [Treponema sp.]|jgi:hypothetical protein|nr:hypothetical protein [Treponema sp.]
MSGLTRAAIPPPYLGVINDDDRRAPGAVKIRRRILAVLALALIFAFTACDTGTGGLTGSIAGNGGGSGGETDGGSDAVSGASESGSSHDGGSAGEIAETPLPETAKTFSGPFAAMLDKVKAEPSGAYLVELAYGAARGPYDMAGFNTPVSIVIDGKGKTVSLAGGYDGKGSLLVIPEGVTVFLKDITLKGCDTNTGAVITVKAGGKLVMKEGAEITGAVRSPVSGGAVRVNAGGSFVMDGGFIRKNTGISNGGGVFISGGEFIMTGGEISGNQASNCGGVFMNEGGQFIMTGGKISGNTSKNYAGGVLVNGGTFEMRGGSIEDNVCHLYGGGVFVQDGGVFVCEGGLIKNNVTQYELWGGGVLVQTKDDGSGFGGADAVSGASSVGGGGGTTYRPGITLVGGVITGNSAGNGRGRSIYHGIGDFTLAGSPAIDGAACIEYQPAAAQHISIDGGFTGTAITLDLRGNEGGITSIGNWMKPLLAMSAGGSIPADVRSRFALGKFTPYSGSPVTNISGYAIGADGKIKAP